MAPKPLTPEQLQEAVDAYYLHNYSRQAAADSIGLHSNTFANRLRQAQRQGYTAKVNPLEAREVTNARRVPRPRTGVKRYIITSAQDGTKVHDGFWRNLRAYAEHLDARIIVGGFTYNKALFEDHGKEDAVFASEVAPYLSNEQIHIADSFAVCCEMNTLPTAVRPLSGLQGYSGKLHGIFPHPKVQWDSIAQPKTMGAKINMTTGAATLPNYVPKKAGLKAQFHHVIGALLLEVDNRGRCWPRHLIADHDGNFQDLDTCVTDGKVTTGNRVEAIVWGDVHNPRADRNILDAAFFGDGNMLDALRPRHQFFHDVEDFQARNHHNIGDIHFLYERWCRNEDSVEADIRSAAEFLERTKRDWCQSVVVESNHDLAFLKWLKRADAYSMDPRNAIFFLESQLAVFRSIREGDDRFSVFEYTARQMADLEGVTFLREDDSYMCGDVECGMHGHLGANGGRGSLAAFSRIGPKSTTAHGHGSGIFDGAYQVGVCQLDLKFNKGLSSWAVVHCVQYPNGKRALVTMQDDGAWRA